MKLEDIKKKNIYTVPDKYFDQLPARIQSRVQQQKPVFGMKLQWNLALKFALPAMTILFFVVYFGVGTNRSNQSVDEILAQVSTNDMIAYLEMTDITTEEIIEGIDFSDIELDFYEDNPIMEDIDDNEIEALLDEYGIDETELL